MLSASYKLYAIDVQDDLCQLADTASEAEILILQCRGDMRLYVNLK